MFQRGDDFTVIRDAYGAEAAEVEPWARRHKTGELSAVVHSEDGEAVAIEAFLHDADRRMVQLLRLHFVQFSGHGVQFAETVASANDLVAQLSAVVEHILIQPAQEVQTIAQQPVLVAHEPHALLVARLHIAAYRSGHEINDEGKPVRCVVEQRGEGRALRRVGHGHAGAGQYGCEHAGMQPVDGADDHHEQQSQVHGFQLAVALCKSAEPFRQQERADDFQHGPPFVVAA